MPIPVTLTANYGNKTVSGTTTANALVLLKNTSSDQVVATTTADGSGNYSFTVSNSVPLQVAVPSSTDPHIFSTLDITSPATPYSSYTGQNCIRLSADSLYYPSPDSLTAWKSMPSATVVDSLGYQTGVFGNIAHTIVFGGSGSGASATLGAAVVGDYRARNSAPYYFVWTSDELNFGTYINKVTWTSFGNSYTAPLLKVSGTSVFYRINNGYISEGEYEINVNGQEYYARDEASTYYYGIYAGNISGQYAYFQTYFPSEANSKTKEWIEEQFNGSSYNLGEWTSLSPPQGQRLTATLPGEQDIAEPEDDSSTNGAQAIQDVKGVVDNANYYNGSQLAAYFAIIYGQNPDDITHTGNPAAPFSGVPSNVLDGGALWAYNQNPKIISKQELDLLKGYFGRKLMVEPISNLLPVSAFWNSYTVATVLLGAWNIIQGVTQTTIATEIQSFSRQFNGVTISDMSQRIKPILDKITAAGGKDFNTLQTQTNAGQRVLWNFNGTQPTNSNI